MQQRLFWSAASDCIQKIQHSFLHWQCPPLTEIGIIHTIFFQREFLLTHTWSFLVEINVKSVGESLLLTEQIQKQVVPLKSLEVYLSTDIKYVGVITVGSTWKTNSEVYFFTPSQPQRIISGLRETFVGRYVVERTNKAEIRPEEKSETAEICWENLWNEIQLKDLKDRNRYKNSI